MAGLHGYRDFSSGETALDRVANHVLLPRQLRDLVAEAQTERQHLLEQLQTLKEELAAERKSKKLAEAAQPTAWNEERARWQSQLAALKLEVDGIKAELEDGGSASFAGTATATNNGVVIPISQVLMPPKD